MQNTVLALNQLGSDQYAALQLVYSFAPLPTAFLLPLSPYCDE